MTTTTATLNDDKPADAKSLPPKEVRCLSRRVWDWGKKWGETLIHLVWFWRAAVLILVLIAGYFAWHEPDVQQRFAATGLMLGLFTLLALDLFVAFLNLPLLLFYALLWSVLTITSLLDIVLYGRHLAAKQNRVAVLILFVNVALVAGAVGLWMYYQSLGNQDDSAQPAVAACLTAILG